MIALATLAWAVQSQNLFQWTGIRRTGQNGYEEYLEAAESMRAPEARTFADWTPPAPGAPPVDDPLKARLNALTPLDVRREELRRFGRVLDLVARGNAKRVFDPRVDPGPATLYPELAYFRLVARFAVRAASVAAADGDTKRATSLLLDALAFADNGARSVLISNLVGATNTAVILGGFAELLPRLSRPDAVRVEQAVDALLARRAAIRDSMVAEGAFSVQAIREALTKKDGTRDLFLLYESDEEEANPRHDNWQRELDGLSATGRQGLFRTFQARVAERSRTIERILSGPERDWFEELERLDGMGEAAPHDLADALMGLTTPVFSGSTDAAARVRTQLRLLGLHARLIQYRWDHGHFPTSLDVNDPLTGEPYLYEVRANGTVRLASKGTAQTGEIELRYRRPVKTDRGVAP